MAGVWCLMSLRLRILIANMIWHYLALINQLNFFNQVTQRFKRVKKCQNVAVIHLATSYSKNVLTLGPRPWCLWSPTSLSPSSRGRSWGRSTRRFWSSFRSSTKCSIFPSLATSCPFRSHTWQASSFLPGRLFLKIGHYPASFYLFSYFSPVIVVFEHTTIQSLDLPQYHC